jgi:hypothetical protein
VIKTISASRRIGLESDEAGPRMLYDVREGVHSVGLEEVAGERQGSVEAGVDETQTEGIIGIGIPIGNLGDRATDLIPQV